MSVVPRCPAFFGAELFSSSSGILRKQSAAVGADVYVFIWSNNLFPQGFCPPSHHFISDRVPAMLRLIEKRTCGKSQKIPEIRVGYFRKQGSFCSCLSLAFCGRRRRQNWQKAPELRAFRAILPSTLHRIIFSCCVKLAVKGPGGLKFAKTRKKGAAGLLNALAYESEAAPGPPSVVHILA
jgi:hypothetical protein